MTPVDMGYPGKHRQREEMEDESLSRGCLILEREKGIFITHLPRRNALFLPVKSVSVLVIALNVGDDQKMQFIL